MKYLFICNCIYIYTQIDGVDVITDIYKLFYDIIEQKTGFVEAQNNRKIANSDERK